MKKAIFTVITNSYDTLLPAPRYSGWDSILFTDVRPIDAKGWEVRKLPKSKYPYLQSRLYKIKSHEYLSEYDLVCYLDGNQKLISAPPEEPIWFIHPRRKDIYQEAKQLIKNGRFSAEDVNAYIEYARRLGYQDSGLFLNGFFVRRHCPDINHLHDYWYKETRKTIPRDQLTLPVAIWRTAIWPENISYPNIKEQLCIIKNLHQSQYTI